MPGVQRLVEGGGLMMPRLTPNSSTNFCQSDFSGVGKSDEGNGPTTALGSNDPPGKFTVGLVIPLVAGVGVVPTWEPACGATLGTGRLMG